MRTIYHAANAIEAQLLQDVLARDGIEAHVLGAHLQGAVGQLPPTGLVRVVVAEEDLAAGQRLVAQWEAGGMALDDDALTAEALRTGRR